MGHCTQSINNYFITRDLPIPTTVNQFCTSAEAATTTDEMDSDNDNNDPSTFLWDSTSEEED